MKSGADLLPADKVVVVEALERGGERVVMLGDGTNDAPALRRATVGVALAAHGGGISAEAADAVILADDPSRLADAIADQPPHPRDRATERLGGSRPELPQRW